MGKNSDLEKVTVDEAPADDAKSKEAIARIAELLGVPVPGPEESVAALKAAREDPVLSKNAD